MKLVGSLLIIMASALLGARKANDLEESYQEMQYVKQMMHMMQSEIRYSKAYLAEAFLTLSHTAKKPYNVWLRQLYYRMESRRGGSFSDIWKDTILEYLREVKLPMSEKKRLIYLGTYLGSSDIEMQLKQLELFGEQLDISMHEMRRELQDKKRICHCLGIMGGIFLAILLL